MTTTTVTNAQHRAAIAIATASETLYAVVPQSLGSIDWEHIAGIAEDRYNALGRAEAEAAGSSDEEGYIIDAQGHVAAIRCIALAQLRLETGLGNDDAQAACLHQVGHLQAIAERVS